MLDMVLPHMSLFNIFCPSPALRPTPLSSLLLHMHLIQSGRKNNSQSNRKTSSNKLISKSKLPLLPKELFFYYWKMMKKPPLSSFSLFLGPALAQFHCFEILFWFLFGTGAGGRGGGFKFSLLPKELFLTNERRWRIQLQQKLYVIFSIHVWAYMCKIRQQLVI